MQQNSDLDPDAAREADLAFIKKKIHVIKEKFDFLMVRLIKSGALSKKNSDFRANIANKGKAVDPIDAKIILDIFKKKASMLNQVLDKQSSN